MAGVEWAMERKVGGGVREGGPDYTALQTKARTLAYTLRGEAPGGLQLACILKGSLEWVPG